MTAPSSAAQAWAASGAMVLTGQPDHGALVPPDAVIERIDALGQPIGVDALALLAERAASLRFARRGRVSCGGSARLLAALDGWMVANLAREDDRLTVPAWLEVDAGFVDPWPIVESIVATRPVGELIERATLVGLPCAALGEELPPAEAGSVDHPLPVATTPFDGVSRSGNDPPVVVDLSSLWAGPLCSRLLADTGADVVKVESLARPDGGRRGPAAFFDRLNAGKRSLALDLQTTEGVDLLGALIGRADVVIEASRPRALRHLGIVAEDLLAETPGPSVWVSITGYGRQHDRVAFGDDAAVAGGLVATDEDGDPCFVADAVADPLTGVAAASAVAECRASGGRWLIDASMAAVAAWVIGADRETPWTSPSGLAPDPPRAASSPGEARELGADTAGVLDELGAPPN